MAFHDPLRLYYKGDKKEAGRYTRDARRLVWQLINEMGRGVTSGRRRTRLRNGVTIDVVVAGKVVAATITVPGGKKRTRWFEDFVVFAGDQAFVGDELVFYPIILKYVEDNNLWIPYFWKSTVPGYALAPSPKGTYVAVFPKPYNPSKQFILYGAPVWHINPDGESVNWYGMQAHKFWVGPYRQPYDMYKGAVFHRGYAIYNYPVYAAKHEISWDEQHVLGAAIKDGWLYMMMGNFNTGISYAMPANPGGVRRTAWASPKYPGFAINYALRRVRLRTEMDYSTGLLHYELTGDSEVLWSGPLARAIGPWHFDKEVTKCVSYGLPVSSTLVYTMGEPELIADDGSFRLYEKEGTVTTGLSSSHQRFELLLDTEAPGGPTASFSQAAQTTAIAESNGKVLEIVRVSGDWYWRLDNIDYPCIVIGEREFTIRTLKYVDIDTHRFLFHEVYESSVGTVTTTRRRTILVHNGTETIVETVTDANDAGNIEITDVHWEGFNVLRNYLSATSISSMAILYLSIWGHMKEKFIVDIPDPGDPPVVYANYYMRLAGEWPRLLETIVDEIRPSYGGGKLNTTLLDSLPGWNTWDVTSGYDGFDDPAWFIDAVPPRYLSNTGGQSLADPDRFMVSARINWFGAPPMWVHYITNGDLGVLSGGTVGVGDKQALSVNILGEPPIGQQVEY